MKVASPPESNRDRSRVVCLKGKSARLDFLWYTFRYRRDWKGRAIGDCPPKYHGPVKVVVPWRPRKGRRSLATGGTRGKRSRGKADPYGVEYLASPCP